MTEQNLKNMISAFAKGEVIIQYESITKHTKYYILIDDKPQYVINLKIANKYDFEFLAKRIDEANNKR